MVKNGGISRVGDLEIDLAARRVTRGGDEIELGRLTFDLFATLVRAAPAAVSNDEIVEAVWDGDIVTDETIKQRVSLLRRALGEAPDGQYVETLRGFGYRLGAPAESSKPADPVADPRVDRSGPYRPSRLVRGIITALVIVSLILVIVVLATVARQVKRMSDVGEGPRMQLVSVSEAGQVRRG